jgi:hypothetical protein
MRRNGRFSFFLFARHIGLVVAALASTAGCNNDLSSGSNSSSSSSSTNASAAGIWTGTDSATGLALIGFVDSNGKADFILADGVQYTGTAQVAGAALALSLEGYPQFGAQFSDGSTYGVGTFNGSVSSGNSISGTLSLTTSDNTTSTSSWSLTFSSLYDTASPLSAVTGTYADSASAVSAGLDPLSGASITISSTGAISSQGGANGCVLNGTVSNGDSSYDVYEVAYTYENCTGTYATLNGVQFTGLADNNPNESPAEVVIGVTGENATGTYYGVVLALTIS